MDNIKQELLRVVDLLIKHDEHVQSGGKPMSSKDATTIVHPVVKGLMDHFIKNMGDINIADFDSKFFDGMKDAQKVYLGQAMLLGICNMGNGFVKELLDEEQGPTSNPLTEILQAIQQMGGPEGGPEGGSVGDGLKILEIDEGDLKDITKSLTQGQTEVPSPPFDVLSEFDSFPIEDPPKVPSKSAKPTDDPSVILEGLQSIHPASETPEPPKQKPKKKDFDIGEFLDERFGDNTGKN